MSFELQSLFEDHNFRCAADAHTSTDAVNDADHLLSGVYFRNLDADTGHIWSTRKSSDDCGMYVLGTVRHLLTLQLFPNAASLLSHRRMHVL